MRIAAWNIAGGHTFTGTNSEALAANYDKEQLDYFIQTIRNVHPHIIALQEVHKPIDASASAQSDIVAQQLNIDRPGGKRSLRQ